MNTKWRIFWIIALVVLLGGLAAALSQIQLARPAQVPEGFVRVVKVNDGDSIEVRLGRVERVRLIGVNTPETVDPHRPVQCYGPEASKHTKSLLPKNSAVRLVADSNPGKDRDKYGRLLRYVYLPNGEMLNQELITGGFGQEYTYRSEVYDHQADFKAAEQQAKAGSRGLWAAATCAGDITRSPQH